MPIRIYSSRTAALVRFALVLLALVAPAGSVFGQMEHRLFITGGTFSISPADEPDPTGNNFGGPLSADYQCTDRAWQAGMNPGWNGIDRIQKALISSTGSNANSRMEIIGRVVNMQGEVLANNQADLWDGTIATGVKYNEFGQLLANNTIFWTGSNSFGVASQTSSNWTSTGGLVNVGTSSATLNWFNQAALAANQGRRLSCLCEARVINPGDFNDDGQVDAADYVVWRHTIGDTVARGVAADGDGNGTVEAADLNVWRAKFGTVYTAGSGASIASASVPEPSTLLLLGIGAISLLGRRKVRRAVRVSS